MLGALLGNDLGESQQSVLGRDIRRLELRGELGMHRAHVDDASAATRPVHVRQARARGEECAVEVDRQHLLPVGEREILQRVHDLDAGIADKDVDAAECGDRRRHARVDRFLAGDVHRDPDGLPAGGTDVGGDNVRGVEVEIGDRDARALAGERHRDGLAEAARGPGDDRGFALQFHHAALPDRNLPAASMPARNHSVPISAGAGSRQQRPDQVILRPRPRLRAFACRSANW